MTSNLGSADILAASRSAAAGGGADEAFSLLTRDRVMAQVGLYLDLSLNCIAAVRAGLICVSGSVGKVWTQLRQRSVARTLAVHT